MVKTYKATIQYTTTEQHPDAQNYSGVFTDTYTIDTERFYLSDPVDIRNYIKHDLALIAGGGYETSTIKNVTYEIQEL